MREIFANPCSEVGQQMVLLALGDNADAGGKCWPKIAEIARKSALSERSVFRIIKALEDAGRLILERAKGGRSHYQIVLQNAAKSSNQTPDTVSPLTDCHPCQIVTPPLTPCQGSHIVQLTTIEPSSTPKRAFREKPDPLAGFTKFWSAYPRSDGKQPAMRAWGKLTDEERTEALADDLTARYGATERQYVPHAATYLNQRRFADPLPPPGPQRINGTTAAPQTSPAAETPTEKQWLDAITEDFFRVTLQGRERYTDARASLLAKLRAGEGQKIREGFDRLLERWNEYKPGGENAKTIPMFAWFVRDCRWNDDPAAYPLVKRKADWESQIRPPEDFRPMTPEEQAEWDALRRELLDDSPPPDKYALRLK